MTNKWTPTPALTANTPYCPWTSKCIGAGNLSEFYMFVSFGMLSFMYIIISTALVPLFAGAR
jgi:hypothetical protein